MNTRSYIQNAEVHSRHAFGASMTVRAALTSLDTDGFTWNQIETATQSPFVVLWFKGGGWTVASVLTQTDTSTAIVVSGLPFRPVGGLVLSHGQAEATADTPQDDDMVSLGAFVVDDVSGTITRGAQSMHDDDGAADSTVNVGVSHDQVYQNVTDAGMVGEMDVQSMDAGGVTFIMDDADPAQAFCLVPLWGATTDRGWYGSPGGWT